MRNKKSQGAVTPWPWQYIRLGRRTILTFVARGWLFFAFSQCSDV